MELLKGKLPINNEVLRWARSSLGLSPSEVARRIGKSEESILSWERGESSPTYPQLERLAYEVYKRPVAVFFFPGIPIEESPKTEFRTVPEKVAGNLPPEIIKAYRNAKVFQLNLEELYEGSKPVAQSLPELFPFVEGADVQKICASVREALAVTIDEQSTWRSPEIAFKKWRSVLEVNGVFVFKDAFHNDEYSGFCIYDNKYPVIFVNNSMPDTRQIFTLFHELGHLLYGSGGVDFRDRRVPESFARRYLAYEVTCNKFANGILVPPEAFQRISLEVTERRFEELADYFSVSREVILRNYLDRGLVTIAYYKKMTAKWNRETRAKKKSGGQYYFTQKAYLGDNYINLAFAQYYKNRISAENLSEYLNIKPKHLENFEHYALGLGVSE